MLAEHAQTTGRQKEKNTTAYETGTKTPRNGAYIASLNIRFEYLISLETEIKPVIINTYSIIYNLYYIYIC